AMAGKINFVNRVVTAFRNCGFQSDFKENSDIELLRSAKDPGYSMFHMDDPFHPRALTMRRAYYYPFWRIEASAKRWEWQVANADFDLGYIDPDLASTFFGYWQNRFFDDAPSAAKDEGYIYIPLQGRLLERRSFQAMSPIEMIKATLAAEPNRLIRATLHPKEQYLRAETEALDTLTEDHPRMTLSSRSAEALVRDCSYVVTQNSSAAVIGYFHRKPAVLFAKIDFHHIAAKVHDLGVPAAFTRVRAMRPPFAKYLFWFLQKMSINAGREDAEDKILATVRAMGWHV
ncbi:MAG: hypothetical protein ACU0DI_09810, partial [Paracoccaceae bacterium]